MSVTKQFQEVFSLLLLKLWGRQALVFSSTTASRTSRCVRLPSRPGSRTASEHTESFEYNDLERVEEIIDEHDGDVVAIVTTPVNLAESEDGYLEGLREIAAERVPCWCSTRA